MQIVVESNDFSVCREEQGGKGGGGGASDVGIDDRVDVSLGLSAPGVRVCVCVRERTHSVHQVRRYGVGYRETTYRGRHHPLSAQHPNAQVLI